MKKGASPRQAALCKPRDDFETKKLFPLKLVFDGHVELQLHTNFLRRSLPLSGNFQDALKNLQ